MKIKLLTKTLKKLVEDCALVIDPITPIEVLKELKLVVMEDCIEITGSNNTLSVVCKYKKNDDEVYECFEEGTVIVDAKTLADILKVVSDDEIVLHSSDSLLKITSGKAKFQVNLVANNIYPNLSIVESDKVFTLKAVDLKQGIDNTLFATDHKNRFELQCIRIEAIGDKITFTGTDGYAISQNSIEINRAETGLGDEELCFSLPQAGAALLSKYLVGVIKADKESVVKMLCNDTKVKFIISVNNTTINIQSTLITSRFPDVNRTSNMFANSKATLKIDKKELSGVLSRAALMVEDNVAVVTLSCTPDSIKAISRAHERGAFDEEMTGEYVITNPEDDEMKNFKITLSVRNVSQAIKVIDSDTIILEFKGILKPVFIRHSDEKGGILEIISPMRTYD